MLFNLPILVRNCMTRVTIVQFSSSLSNSPNNIYRLGCTFFSLKNSVISRLSYSLSRHIIINCSIVSDAPHLGHSSLCPKILLVTTNSSMLWSEPKHFLCFISREFFIHICFYISLFFHCHKKIPSQISIHFKIPDNQSL